MRTYLMKSGDEYKIGKAKTPHERLKKLKPARPDIELLADCDEALVSEAALHKMYSSKNTEGEWFKLSDADVQSITELMESDTTFLNPTTNVCYVMSLVSKGEGMEYVSRVKEGNRVRSLTEVHGVCLWPKSYKHVFQLAEKTFILL